MSWKPAECLRVQERAAAPLSDSVGCVRGGCQLWCRMQAHGEHVAEPLSSGPHGCQAEVLAWPLSMGYNDNRDVWVEAVHSMCSCTWRVGSVSGATLVFTRRL